MPQVLVTGGAGYIGSHLALAAADRGLEVIIYDNLSTGHFSNVLDSTLIQGDLADLNHLEKTLQSHHFDAVFHFAGSIVVPESVTNPIAYYQNNTVNTLNLIKLCLKYDVHHFIFSSTAAVYGNPTVEFIPETTPLNPINPYGRSKLMSEWFLEDIGATSGNFHFISLRYFNVAGADFKARIGQRSKKSTHLIKRTCETILGKHPSLAIYGDDYPTPDRTCIRDYIHVLDLIDAHLKAYDYLKEVKQSHIMNCGYGRGYSVKEVLKCAEKVAQKKLNIELAPRRPGDGEQLISDPTKIKKILGWKPQYDNLELIIRSALDWEKKLLHE